MYFSKNITVDAHDVDFNGVARASSIMRYMQSTAEDQLASHEMSYDQLKESGKAFILSKIKIEFLKPLYANDKILAETFPCDSYGYTFLRCYRIIKGDEIVARAASIWALVDISNKSLVRVKNFDLGLETYAPISDLPMERILLPAEISEVGEYRVTYGEIDRNNHMNNTKYPDMYSTFLPLENKRIKTLSIDFINEARRFEKLKVMSAKSDGGFYFKTEREDGKVNSISEITLTDI